MVARGSHGLGWEQTQSFQKAGKTELDFQHSPHSLKPQEVFDEMNECQNAPIRVYPKTWSLVLHFTLDIPVLNREA